MGDSLTAKPEVFLYREKTWPIFSGPHTVARRLHIEEAQLVFALDVASLICAKRKRPLWKLTAPGQKRDVVRMRQYFIFLMRRHPHTEEWRDSGKGGMVHPGVSFPDIARLVDRDHTSVMHSMRRLEYYLERYPTGEHARELSEIASQLDRISTVYGFFDISPFLGRKRNAA